MEKVWFIKVDDIEEGPFSFAELKRHPRLTPDTLVRKKGSSLWTLIRHVAELKKVFEDIPAVVPSASEDEGLPENNLQVEKDELLLDASNDTPPYLFWLLMITVLFYTAYQLYLNR